MRLMVTRHLAISWRIAPLTTVAWRGLLGILAGGGGVGGGVGGVAVLGWGFDEAGEVGAAVAAE